VPLLFRFSFYVSTLVHSHYFLICGTRRRSTCFALPSTSNGAAGPAGRCCCAHCCFREQNAAADDSKIR